MRSDETLWGALHMEQCTEHACRHRERVRITVRGESNVALHLSRQQESPLAHRTAANLTGRWNRTAMADAFAPRRDQMTSTVV